MSGNLIALSFEQQWQHTQTTGDDWGNDELGGWDEAPAENQNKDIKNEEMYVYYMFFLLILFLFHQNCMVFCVLSCVCS